MAWNDAKWRRHLFVSSLAIIASTPLVASSQEIDVVLLGTGHPPPLLDRFGPSTLVRAGDQVLLFDAGRGAMQRLFQLGLGYGELDAVFLTHLHSDHVVGLPDLWLTGWLMSRRAFPLALVGPAGTDEMVTHLRGAFAFDIAIRIEDDALPPDGALLEVREVSEDLVYDVGGVRVTSLLVDHRPIEPALGYRVDYAGRSVVISGDTRFSENLIDHSGGVDLLIHEVAGASESYLSANPFLREVVAHHTTAQEAGEVFRRAQPGLAVYSHLVLLGGFPTEEIVRLTRTIYDGPLVVGEDLMRFRVGEEVAIVRP